MQSLNQKLELELQGSNTSQTCKSLTRSTSHSIAITSMVMDTVMVTTFGMIPMRSEGN